MWDKAQGQLAHAGKLFALGVLIQGGVASEGHFPVWDLARLRVFGVLQRIALAYCAASLLLYFFKTRTTVVITCVILVFEFVSLLFVTLSSPQKLILYM